MGKRTGRKVLSILLAVCVMIGGLGSPVAGYATEGGQGVEAETPGQGAENGQDEVAEMPEQGVESSQGVDDGQSMAAEDPVESAQAMEMPPYELQPLPEDDIVVESVYEGLEPGEEANLRAAALPAQYDSRNNGWITPVKNQGSYGTCWAFAAINCAEASLMRKGLVDTIDLSELHLAYFFYHSATDPLENTAGDGNEPLGENYLQRGGNSVFTTFALASWTGAALEGLMRPSYAEGPADFYADTYAYQDMAHLQNVYWISFTDPGEIKKMIMEHGAVATSFCEESAYFNVATSAYYRPTYKKNNHAISIVGWDDTYSRTNFNTPPSRNGAWLVKNSWGSGHGNQGYFWLSYEDAALLNQDLEKGTTGKAFVFDFESSDNYDYNYQYDGAAGIEYGAVMNGGKIANIYQVKGNKTTKQGIGDPYAKERLQAVSFAVNDVNVRYTIDIYRNLTDPNNPESGAKVATQSGSVTYVGYHTVKLETPVELNQGDRFSVVVTLSGAAGNGLIGYYQDKSYTNAGWIRFTSKANWGQSFEKYSGATAWTDLYGEGDGTTARIKAFTTTVDRANVPVTGMKLNKSALTVAMGDTRTLTAIITPYNATNRAVNWSSSDSGVATVESNGEVRGVAPGTATITATTSDGSKIAICQVTVERVSVTGVTLNKTALSLTTGAGETLAATVSPGNATDRAVNWSSDNPGVATVGSNGEVRGVAPGTATITATTRDGGKTASCRVTVTDPYISVNGVSLNRSEMTLATGSGGTLAATVSPGNATDRAVTWSSDNPGVATVGSNGEVHGNAPGAATITVRTRDGGRTASCRVTVTAPGVSVSYRTHVQDHGWQGWKQNGGFSGTEGESRRLEGINIAVSGNGNLGIRYKTAGLPGKWRHERDGRAVQAAGGHQDPADRPGRRVL